MSRVKNAIAVITCVLAVLAALASAPARSLGADNRTTPELLQDLGGLLVNDQALRRELAARSDLVSTIAQLVEQKRATQQMIWLLEEGPFERIETVLRKAIDSKDRFVRSATCMVLGSLGDPRGVPILDQYLARYLSKPTHKMNTIYNQEDEGAVNALEALTQIEGPMSDQVLGRVLGHSSPLLRFLAARELAGRGKESAVPVLVGLLSCTDQANSSCFTRRVYQEARRALQELTYVYDMSVYSDLDDQDLKPFRCDQMLHRGQEQSLTEKRAAVAERWKASWQTWWESHKQQARSQWRKESLAWSKDAICKEKARDEAVERLLLIGDKDAIDLLFALVNNPKTPSKFQVRTVQNMWFQKNPLLEEPLRHVLDHHPSVEARAAAAYALNGFRSKASGEALVRALANQATMREAVGSLRFYPYQEFLAALLPFLKHADADVRESARIAVDAIRAEGSEPILLEQLGKGPIVASTIAIIEALRWRGTEKSLPQLMALLHHGNRRVRTAAVEAIESIAKVDFDYAGQDDPDHKSRMAIERWWAQRKRDPDNSPLPNPR